MHSYGLMHNHKYIHLLGNVYYTHHRCQFFFLHRPEVQPILMGECAASYIIIGQDVPGTAREGHPVQRHYTVCSE